MRKHKILYRVASIAVCVGMLLSNTAIAFEGETVQVARDVELTRQNEFQGVVYTSEGRPVENAPVELRYQGTAIARTTTGSQGEFLVTGVRGGAHDGVVGSMSSPVRLWKNGTAPESAVEGFVVAADEKVVRGQACDPYAGQAASCPPTSSGFGLIDVVTLGLLATSVTALVYAIDTNNELDDLNKKLASP